MNRRQARAVAAVLAREGFASSDGIRHHDMDEAADFAGVGRPETRDDRAAVADAYDELVEG